MNTADEDSFADRLASLADRIRPEAYVKDVIPLTAAATFRQTLPAGLALRARGGLTGLFLTQGSDPEAALDYGIAGTYTAGVAQLGPRHSRPLSTLPKSCRRARIVGGAALGLLAGAAVGYLHGSAGHPGLPHTGLDIPDEFEYTPLFALAGGVIGGLIGAHTARCG